MYDKYRKILRSAPIDKAFKSAYEDVRSLRELRDSLVGIGKPFYDEFINREENHFANWIENVFGDEDLAKTLRTTRSYGKSIKVLNNRINYLQLWLLFNSEKEILAKYLTNGPFSLKKLLQAKDFHPEHHKFETVHEFNKKHQKKLNQPKFNAHEQQLLNLQHQLGIEFQPSERRSLLRKLFRK